NWEAQLGLLSDLAAYREELREIDRLGADGFDFQNGYFAGFDAAVYYSLIRHLKPGQVIEVGGGYSTQIAQRALARNRDEGNEGKLVCVEPYPEPRLTDKKKIEFDLIEKPVQEIQVDFFSSLEANDILFIDSTHTVKFGSDVCYEFLDILPKLSSAVWVHVHDIFFPHDYPSEWLLEKRMALNEQYLLEAFLAFNVEFSVQLSNHWICLDHGEVAAQLWPGDHLGQTCSSSFWMKRV
ncbi:MAG TPA: class I SAM-dependent methyltransferase, partial [Pyrinomonadaceae bacterium]